MSQKRATENRRRRKAVTEKYGTGDVRCELGYPHVKRCTGWADDVHEPKLRSRGGAIDDPDNMVALCRACHDWVHAHPVAAADIGMIVS